MQHYNEGYDELYHYGVLGMKWGKRKERDNNIIESRKKLKEKQDIMSRVSKDYEKKVAAGYDRLDSKGLWGWQDEETMLDRIAERTSVGKQYHLLRRDISALSKTAEEETSSETVKRITLGATAAAGMLVAGGFGLYTMDKLMSGR